MHFVKFAALPIAAILSASVAQADLSASLAGRSLLEEKAYLEVIETAAHDIALVGLDDVISFQLGKLYNAYIKLEQIQRNLTDAPSEGDAIKAQMAAQLAKMKFLKTSRDQINSPDKTLALRMLAEEAAKLEVPAHEMISQISALDLGERMVFYNVEALPNTLNKLISDLNSEAVSKADVCFDLGRLIGHSPATSGLEYLFIQMDVKFGQLCADTKSTAFDKSELVQLLNYMSTANRISLSFRKPILIHPVEFSLATLADGVSPQLEQLSRPDQCKELNQYRKAISQLHDTLNKELRLAIYLRRDLIPLTRASVAVRNYCQEKSGERRDTVSEAIKASQQSAKDALYKLH